MSSVQEFEHGDDNALKSSVDQRCGGAICVPGCTMPETLWQGRVSSKRSLATWVSFGER